ncbi:MAG: protein kinase [Herpetosiphonaceae bacterium]|nr:protein kinase [Herpetosiphonaceae bacterium]
MAANACYFCNSPVAAMANNCPACGQPQILQGKYRVVRLLGQGGFALVYEVLDLRLNRRYALKLITNASGTAQKQVEAEANILAQHARHLHCMPEIYDIWSDGAATSLLMEYVEGPTLQELVDQQGPWPARTVEQFLQAVLPDLVRIHALGIIHRDLKPDNIKQTPDGRYVLLDFGIAKHTTGGTLTGAKAASLHYSPPEQIRGHPTDGRSDLYSLGATAYHMLTGQPPIPCEYRAAFNMVLPPPSQVVVNVPPPLSAAIMSMLELDPVQRPRDAQAALALLNASGVTTPTKAVAQLPSTPGLPPSPAVRTMPTIRVSSPLQQRLGWLTLIAAGAGITLVLLFLVKLVSGPSSPTVGAANTSGITTIASANTTAIGQATTAISVPSPTTTPATPTQTVALPTATVTSPAVMNPSATTFVVAPVATAVFVPSPTTALSSAVVAPVDVSRNHSLILGWSITSPIGVTNPWAVPGYTHQEGNAFMWEGLSYFGIFADKEIPWLAESMTYNADFTQLKIKLRKEAMWSDGQPVTSKDIVYTFEGQLKNEKLPYHAKFMEFVKDVKADDDQNVTVNFNMAAPRFKFEVLTLKFDTGIPIVPEHTLSEQPDVNAFQGGLTMPHSGPYNLVQWDKNQKIFYLRPDWWAIKAGVAKLPDVKHIVMVNIGGQVGLNMDTVAQRLINNEMDSSLDMRSSVIGNILKQNPKITSWTGNASPYGYLDWWPNSLWMNDQLAPYSDPNVRKAISLSINRDQINEVLYEGAKIATIYPFPLYPNLQKFADSPAVKALEAKYKPGAFDLGLSAKLMTAAGFTKNADDLWEKDGKTISAVINGFEGIHRDIAPFLVEMLKAGGFDASVNFGTDASQNMADGKPGFYLFGHGASTVDPYAAFELYASRFNAPNGTAAGGGRWSRYKNPEYDKIIDAMAPLSADDPKFQALATQALEIYWRDTIDIPVIQWLHRIPYNNTYWTNWPSSTNVANGENGAFWAHTGMLVVTNLKAAQP